MLQSSVRRRRGPVKGQGPQSPRITQAWTEVPKGHRAPGQRGAISPSPGLSCGTLGKPNKTPEQQCRLENRESECASSHGGRGVRT